MNRWLKKLEFLTDKVIPYSLILLMGVIIINLFFENLAEHYHVELLIADNLVVLIFILDLIFKYIRIKPFKTFLKKSWLDILAVFPFVLVFRFVEVFADVFLFTSTLKEGQSILHQTLELEKEAVHIIQEAERAKTLSRTSRFFRLFRPIAKIPRLVKAVSYFEKPFKHHKTVAFNPPVYKNK